VVLFFARAAALVVVFIGKNMAADTEEALVRSARNGDRAAFEELIRRTSRLIFARLFLEVGDMHRAEDLLQETWLRAYRNLAKLEKPGDFRAWLLRIAQNVVIDDARRETRQKRAAPAARRTLLEGLADHTPLPGDALERDELREQVLAVLRSLPEEYRLPLTLRYLGGADYETISTQLGLTNGSLRGLLHRGLKLLRARFEQQK
jgi:RNA polymerase sigma-70 factor (ECF subfamily)